MAICPECGAEGKGPRFNRRHPSLCKQRKENTEWSRNLAARTRAVDDNDWQQLDSETKEAVKDILRQKEDKI